MMSHPFQGEGDLKHKGHLSSSFIIIYHPDDTKFKIWCQYSKTLNNIFNQPLKCVHTEVIKQFYKNTLVYCTR